MQRNIWKFKKKTEEYNEQPANILSSLQRDFGVFGDDDDLSAGATAHIFSCEYKSIKV